MHSDDIAVLHAQIVADHPIHTGAAVVEFIIGQHDEHRVSPLLAFDEHGVAAEELKRLHRVVRQSDDRVVIIDGIGDAATPVSMEGSAIWRFRHDLHQRIGLLLLFEDGRRCVIDLHQVSSRSGFSRESLGERRTSFFSAPEASLSRC